MFPQGCHIHEHLRNSKTVIVVYHAAVLTVDWGLQTDELCSADWSLELIVMPSASGSEHRFASIERIQSTSSSFIIAKFYCIGRYVAAEVSTEDRALRQTGLD